MKVIHFVLFTMSFLNLYAQNDLNTELCKSVMVGDTEQAEKHLSSGADVNCPCAMGGENFDLIGFTKGYLKNYFSGSIPPKLYSYLNLPRQQYYNPLTLAMNLGHEKMMLYLISKKALPPKGELKSLLKYLSKSEYGEEQANYNTVIRTALENGASIEYLDPFFVSDLQLIKELKKKYTFDIHSLCIEQFFNSKEQLNDLKALGYDFSKPKVIRPHPLNYPDNMIYALSLTNSTNLINTDWEKILASYLTIITIDTSSKKVIKELLNRGVNPKIENYEKQNILYKGFFWKDTSLIHLAFAKGLKIPADLHKNNIADYFRLALNNDDILILKELKRNDYLNTELMGFYTKLGNYDKKKCQSAHTLAYLATIEIDKQFLLYQGDTWSMMKRPKDIQVLTSAGFTPDMIWKSFGFIDQQYIFQEDKDNYDQSFLILLNNGLDVKNQVGIDLLDKAIKHHLTKSLEALSEKKADIERAYKSKDGFLELAINYGNMEAISLLKESGFDFGAPCGTEKNALKYAALQLSICKNKSYNNCGVKYEEMQEVYQLVKKLK